MAQSTIFSNVKNISNGTVDPSNGSSRVGGVADSAIRNPNANGLKSANYEEDVASVILDIQKNSYVVQSYEIEDVKNRKEIKIVKTATAIRDNKWNDISGAWDSNYPETGHDTASTAILSDNITQNRVSYNYAVSVTTTGV